MSIENVKNERVSSFLFFLACVCADVLHGGEIVKKMYWTNESYFDGDRCAIVNVRPRIHIPPQPWGTYCVLQYSSTGYLNVIAHNTFFTRGFPMNLAQSATCSNYADLESIYLDETLGILKCGQNREAIMWY